MKLSVCLPALFPGIPIVKAMAQVRRAGLDTVEIWGWEGKELDDIKAGLRENKLNLAAMCTKAFVLNDPGKRAEFMEGLKESIAAAEYLHCPILITQVGQELKDVPRQKQHEAIVEGLREAARVLEGQPVTLCIEPLNSLVDHKGTYLTHAKEGFDIIRSVGSEKIRLLYDIYHQQVTEVNILMSLRENLDLIAHVHIAGVPGRHEPHLDCELNYPHIFKKLKDWGYAVHIGFEYLPTLDPVIGIKAAVRMLKDLKTDA